MQLLAIGITFMETLNALATRLLSKYVSPLDLTHRPAFTTQGGNKEMMFPSFVCPLHRLVLSEVANQCKLKSCVSNIVFVSVCQTKVSASISELWNQVEKSDFFHFTLLE